MAAAALCLCCIVAVLSLCSRFLWLTRSRQLPLQPPLRPRLQILWEVSASENSHDELVREHRVLGMIMLLTGALAITPRHNIAKDVPLSRTNTALIEVAEFGDDYDEEEDIDLDEEVKPKRRRSSTLQRSSSSGSSSGGASTLQRSSSSSSSSAGGKTKATLTKSKSKTSAKSSKPKSKKKKADDDGDNDDGEPTLTASSSTVTISTIEYPDITITDEMRAVKKIGCHVSIAGGYGRVHCDCHQRHISTWSDALARSRW